jgi:hypothetical protein
LNREFSSVFKVLVRSKIFAVKVALSSFLERIFSISLLQVAKFKSDTLASHRKIFFVSLVSGSFTSLWYILTILIWVLDLASIQLISAVMPGMGVVLLTPINA